MNYNSIKKNIREIGLMFLSAGLLLFLSCGSDDTKDVSSEDGEDVYKRQTHTSANPIT